MSSHVFAYYETADTQAAQNALYVLEEGGRTLQIDKRWTVRLDSPHHPRMDHHVHILYRGNEVSIVNKDGTPSHHTTRDAVPNWLIENFKSQGLIEKSSLPNTASYAEKAYFTLPAEIIASAERRAKMLDVLESIRPRPSLQRFKRFLTSWRRR